MRVSYELTKNQRIVRAVVIGVCYGIIFSLIWFFLGIHF